MMGLFSFIKKKRNAGRAPVPYKAPEKTLQQKEHDRICADIWENEKAIYIGCEHVSGGDMHIMCEVRFFPERRLVIRRSTATCDPEPRYTTTPVPESVHSAEELLPLLGPIPCGFCLTEELARRLNEAL